MRIALIAMLLAGLLVYGCVDSFVEKQVTDKDALFKAFSDENIPLKCTFALNDTTTKIWRNGKNIALSIEGQSFTDDGTTTAMKVVVKDKDAYVDAKSMTQLALAFSGSVEKPNIDCDWIKSTTNAEEDGVTSEMSSENFQQLLEQEGVETECFTGGVKNDVFETPGTTCTQEEFQTKIQEYLPSFDELTEEDEGSSGEVTDGSSEGLEDFEGELNDFDGLSEEDAPVDDSTIPSPE